MAWSQSGNIRGASGIPGASGASGLQGASGVPGSSGASGPAGPAGASGAVGATGASGGTGATGGTGGTGGPGTTTWAGITDKPGAILNYKGTWNVSTNTPTLSDSTGSGGDVYRVSVAGSRNLGSGTISWEIGDYAIYSPVTSSWEKADTTDAVSSVAGRTGAVTLTSADLGASGTPSASTFLRGDNTWATPAAGITRSVSTITTETTLGSATNTDYVVFSAGSGDTSFSSVSALLLFEGTNGSTTFTDNATSAGTWTASGTAQISTSQAKFGTASLNPGTGYISQSSASRFNISGTSFTIELFVRPSTVTSAFRVITNMRTSNAVNAPVNVFQADAAIYWEIGTANLASATTGTSTSVLSANTWSHIAVVGNGSTVKLYVDGTERLSTSQPTWTSQNYPVAIGGESGTTSFSGFIDNYRFTKGVARYTSSFTPPSTTFTSSSSAGAPTLPTAVGNTNAYTVRSTADGVVVTTTSSQLINSNSTYTVSPLETATFISNGTQWYTV